MPKKNPWSDRRTRAARKAKTRRKNEEPWERELRLYKDKTRQINRRRNETATERADRLASERVRVAEKRRRETSSEREARLVRERDARRAARRALTPEQKLISRYHDRIRGRQRRQKTAVSVDSVSLNNEGPHVTLAQGALVGKESTNENGKVYHSYLGIPYAKPPLGNLRFKPPERPECWTGVRNATAEGNACRSPHIFLKNLIGDEDCLYLNVHVPQISQISDIRDPLPVMVWIHGGDFSIGSGNTDLYGPDWLMDYDVIQVTFNYRLGVLGFLNLEIEEAPGNVGLMDQVAVLKWVQENIAAFGGDPDNVTIFGVSAGGASVHYLMLSDTARGLFHKAIAQSGSALNPWAFQLNHVECAYQLCAILGYPVCDPLEALEFLKQIPVDDLLSAKMPLDGYGQQLMINEFTFVPSVEKRFPGHEPFLTETPLTRMQSENFSNTVPFMTGFNDAEGIIHFTGCVRDPEFYTNFGDNFEKFFPSDLGLALGSQASLMIGEEIRNFYYRDRDVCEENVQKMVDIISDTLYIRGVNDTVKLMVEKSTRSPVYYYEYSFSQHGFYKSLSRNRFVEGACHGDELEYLFKNEYSLFPSKTPEIAENQKRLLMLWTNFAKTGNPTPEFTDLIRVKWKPATRNKLSYLSICDEGLRLGFNPKLSRMQFWDNLTESAVEPVIKLEIDFED